MTLLESVVDILINLSYSAIVIAIFAGSFGVPIPEEIVLMIIGYLAGIDFFDLKYALLISLVSMIAADNFSYLLGYHGTRFVTWILRKTKTAWLREHLKEHPRKTIFFSRFLSGLRVFFPIAAGSIHLPWKTFFFTDLLAVMILVPVFVLLGFFLRAQFDTIIAGIIHLDKVVLIIFVGVIIVSFLGVEFLKRLIFGRQSDLK